MKIKLYGGDTWVIPKGVKYANIQIGFSEDQLKFGLPNIRQLERECAFERDKEMLIGYRYIGYVESRIDDLNLEVERHWFIRTVDINKCKYISSWSES